MLLFQLFILFYSPKMCDEPKKISIRIILDYNRCARSLGGDLLEENKSRHYSFFQHKECEYFPCHAGLTEEEFNCLFCYCPLYCLGENCGGDYHYTKEGIKDCTNCIFPHIKKNYSRVIERFPELREKAKKKHHRN